MCVHNMDMGKCRGGSSGGYGGARAPSTTGNYMKPLLNPSYKFVEEERGKERLEKEEEEESP